MTDEKKQYTDVQQRAAIYRRRANSAQRQVSWDDQKSICRTLAEEKGWSVADEHVRSDTSTTGMSLESPRTSVPYGSSADEAPPF